MAFAEQIDVVHFPTVRKVTVYITSGDRLVTFTQPRYPDAGVQVPAGTVGIDETVEAAAIREAIEETGLRTFGPPRVLGSMRVDMPPWGDHERWFVHLPFQGDVGEPWEWVERNVEGSDEQIVFRLQWEPIVTVALIGVFGTMLDRLD